MNYHTSILPVKKTGTHPSLIMSNLTTKTGMTGNPLCHCSSLCLTSMETCTIILRHSHTSCLDHVNGEPLPIEAIDDDSIFEDAREMDEDDDVTLANLDDSVNLCVYQSNFHHLLCNVNAMHCIG